MTDKKLNLQFSYQGATLLVSNFSLFESSKIKSPTEMFEDFFGY